MIDRIRKTLHTLVAIAAATWAASGSAAMVYQDNFAAAGNEGHPGYPGFYFAVGDEASQTFTGTGLGSVGEMQLTLNLGPTGNTLNFEALGFTFYLNGVAVGTTSYPPFDQSIRSLDFTFPALTSPNDEWTLEMLVTTGVCATCRTVQFSTGDPPPANTLKLFAAVPVPEPATLALLGTALAILGWSARRRP